MLARARGAPRSSCRTRYDKISTLFARRSRPGARTATAAIFLTPPQAYESVMQSSRYAYLDGIRGIAALLVMLRHSDHLLGMATYRSYLAVDLFFLLSGFVIAHAYDGRLRDGVIGFGEFVRIRVIRLYPVYALSIVLAAAVTVLAFVVGGKLNANMLTQLSMATAMTLLFLPFPVSWSNYLFPLNPVCWSLFFELIVNFAYGALRSKLSDRVLKLIALAAAIVCAAGALKTGSLDRGWAFSAESVIIGLARATFGFALGILLYRRRTQVAALVRGRVTPWLSFAVVAVVLCSPSIPLADGWIDLACIVVLLPIAVAGAAFAAPPGGRTERSMFVLGAASYPLYVLHSPIIYLTWQCARRLGPEFVFPAGVLMVVGLVFLSVQLEQRVDIPLRRWLNARWPKRSKESSAPAP
ncbi:acyltransferase family protein [Pseudoduganella chitinolytica]|uniref:Acyltransferase n=1 Tax=Pseudoduganella chitinolytica TaxID=34070 RepID=A0ABY8BID6_9BURK|nr:acyltransferase [Pseudoduganella chitinolytica]WEF35660.1 acyltransferase [Pseudoduganella chitinolytica]